MRSVRKYYSVAFVVLALLSTVYLQNAPAQKIIKVLEMNFSPQEKKIISQFEKSAKGYSNLREGIEQKLPKLPAQATPEQIDAHKTSFQKSVRTARANARQGDLFTPSASALIRKIIKNESKGKEREELRETALEGDNKAVPLKVNFPYPENQEQVEMSPELLINLPQLPKHLRYRFVGRNLLLVDRENGLIVDFMTNALP